jgi:hypothetical protein
MAVRLLMDAGEHLRHGSEWSAGIYVERGIDAVWAICPPSGQDCLCMDSAEQAEDGDDLLRPWHALAEPTLHTYLLSWPSPAREVSRVR